jgi:membrane-associated phospholipid phosphatase
MKNTEELYEMLPLHQSRRILCCAATLVILLNATDSHAQESMIPDSARNLTPALMQVDTPGVPDGNKPRTPKILYTHIQAAQLYQRGFLKSGLADNSIVPLILIAGSISSWHFREDFRHLRNQYAPSFRNRFDDYLQYTPAFTVLSLKLTSIKGTYSTKRTIASYVFSALIMAGITNALKHTTKINRPDGTARNSFPSGHTANAFMNATFLHQQYGDRSLAYSVGGYSSAILTAIGRQLNNRHWVPDILAGAAIGILSAELGNFLAGRLFKTEPLRARLPHSDPGSLYPGFISLRMDYRIPLTARGSDYAYVMPGMGLAIDAGWFVNKFVGIGAEAGLYAHPVFLGSGAKSTLPWMIPNSGEHKITFTGRYLRAGPVFRRNIGTGWALNGKLMLGTSLGPSATSRSGSLPSYEIEKVFSWSSGIEVQKKIKDHLGIKTYFAYDSPIKTVAVFSNGNTKFINRYYPSRLHTLSWGIGISALF